MIWMPQNAFMKCSEGVYLGNIYLEIQWVHQSICSGIARLSIFEVYI